MLLNLKITGVIFKSEGSYMPKKKFDNDIILKCAVNLAKEMGLEKLSMRRLAAKLNCSVMPIYDAFESKDTLIEAIFEEIISENNKNISYFQRNKEILISGIRHPLLYKDIRNQGEKSDKLLQYYADVIDLMKKEKGLSGFNVRELESLNFDILVYISGLVERSTSKTMSFTEDQYITILNQVTELFILGYNAASSRK